MRHLPNLAAMLLVSHLPLDVNLRIVARRMRRMRRLRSQ